MLTVIRRGAWTLVPLAVLPLVVSCASQAAAPATEVRSAAPSTAKPTRSLPAPRAREAQVVAEPNSPAAPPDAYVVRGDSWLAPAPAESRPQHTAADALAVYRAESPYADDAADARRVRLVIEHHVLRNATSDTLAWAVGTDLAGALVRAAGTGEPFTGCSEILLVDATTGRLAHTETACPSALDARWFAGD